MAEALPERHEVAIFEKNGGFAVLKLSVVAAGGFIGQTDPRNNPPQTVMAYQSPALADEFFKRSIDKSIENGWALRWLGTPKRG